MFDEMNLREISFFISRHKIVVDINKRKKTLLSTYIGWVFLYSKTDIKGISLELLQIGISNNF